MLKNFFTHKLLCGDAEVELSKLESDSVDLIITSPPYANKRGSLYPTIKSFEYVDWFLPISKQLFRVLKPTGTFILNIKESVRDGERDIYVLQLILALRRHGWMWTEEFVWHKKNSFPGKWPNRFRDSWERLLQFNKQRQFSMYQDEVRVPVGDWAAKRLQNLSENDQIRLISKTGSPFDRNISNWVGKSSVYPTNVLNLATECQNRSHGAAFPEALPSWFIKLFTKEGDVVLDPFLGSGTTSVAAHKLNRNSIGIDIDPKFLDIARNRLQFYH